MTHPVRESQGNPAKEPHTDASASAPVPPSKEGEVTREGTVEVIERIESLTLEDFATDFSKLSIPDKEGPLSDGEMKVAVDAFLSSLERN